MKHLDDLTEKMKEIKISDKMYIPTSKAVLNIMRENWRNMNKPVGVIDATHRLIAPQSYLLWKLTPENHSEFNRIMEDVPKLLRTISPRTSYHVGIFNGLSQLVYGLKTQQGKHVLSGLYGLQKHLEKVDHPSSRNTLIITRRLLNRFLPDESFSEREAT